MLGVSLALVDIRILHKSILPHKFLQAIVHSCLPQKGNVRPQKMCFLNMFNHPLMFSQQLAPCASRLSLRHSSSSASIASGDPSETYRCCSGVSTCMCTWFCGHIVLTRAVVVCYYTTALELKPQGFLENGVPCCQAQSTVSTSYPSNPRSTASCWLSYQIGHSSIHNGPCS